MDFKTAKNIIEAALLASERPLRIRDLVGLFTDSPDEKASSSTPSPEDNDSGTQADPDRKMVKAILAELNRDCATRCVELKEVASGFRYQIRTQYATYIQRLQIGRPARYSRALLETLAIIAYRQPVTRGEIEEIRGVSVASSILKTLREREWIRVLGHRDVPGRPALYGTTHQFLDYFNLRTLDELPPLKDIQQLDFKEFGGEIPTKNAAVEEFDV